MKTFIRHKLLNVLFFTMITLMLCSTASHAYDISGTVTYPGGTASRVYITTYADGGTLSTSIPFIGSGGSAPFTIRGFPAGSYYLQAYIDTTGTKRQHVFDPNGSSTPITVTIANVTGTNINLANPLAVFPPSPTAPSLFPGNGSAIVGCESVSSYTSSGSGEAADSYTIYWSVDATVSPTHTTGGGSKTIASTGSSPIVLLTGLQNGQALYFVTTARVETQESAPSPVVGPIIIGALTGGSTVSGTISYSGSTTGAVVVNVYSNDGSKNFLLSYINPTFPLNYSVSGIPSGAYTVVAALDANNNGLIADNGDIVTRKKQDSNRFSTDSAVAVNGVNMNLPDSDAEAVVTISHTRSSGSDSYSTSLSISGQKKIPVNTAIVSGPGIAGPIDIQNYWNASGATIPVVGSTYTFNVEYSDGTTGTLSASITGMLDIATPLSPTGTITSSRPTFTWSALVTPPTAPYTYSLNLSGGGDYWSPSNIPSTQLSALYNFDGSANGLVNQTNLAGGNYNWSVTTYDQYGNSSYSNSVSFNSPDITPPTISMFTLPASSTSLTIPVTLIANDNVGVTGYCITEVNSSIGCVWSTTVPASYTFFEEGNKTLYLWAKDAVGNISSSKSASTIIVNLPTSYTYLPKTSQTKCYDMAGGEIACAGTGQDGEKQTGVAWPNPRFIDNFNGTVTDNLTGLVWLKNATCLGIKFYYDALSGANGLTSGTCGLTDGSTAGQWRLPNINELRSLVDSQNIYPALPSGHPFGVIGSHWWSSTFSYGSDGIAGIDMDLGVETRDNRYFGSNGQGNYYWPVRDGQSGAQAIFIPKTGQTSGWTAGDDGSLQKGISWPNPRFNDNTDGTVTDNLTGLIWLKNAGCFSNGQWDTALSSANTLASGSCGLSDGSAIGDWRLPNRNELGSILDVSKYYPALPAGYPFINVKYDGYNSGYWSSSSISLSAWYVNIWNGGVFKQSKSEVSPNYAWPVRGGKSWFVNSLTISGENSFSLHNIGAEPMSNEITIRNNGTLSQTITSEVISGTNASDFSIDVGGSAPCSSLSPNIEPGESCTMKMLFNPTSVGTKNATLTVSVNGSSTGIRFFGTAISTIRGVVKNLSTGSRLAGATIAISGGSNLLTDAYGAFSFNPPPVAGVYNVTISKTGFQPITINNVTLSNTQGGNLDVWITPTDYLNLLPVNLAPASIGVVYKQQLLVAGGNLPYTFSKIYGTLPAGLFLNGTNGIISGTPTNIGSFTFGVGVTDSLNNYSEIELTLDVAAPLQFASSPILPRATIGKVWSFSLAANGGVGPYSYLTLNQPYNVSLDKTGLLSSTPSTAGSFGINIIVSDATGRYALKYFNFSVDAPLTITTTRLNDCIVGTAFSQTLVAAGGYSSDTWNIFSGQLPEGLALNSSTGVISGTATSTTSQQIVISVQDSFGRVAYKQFTINALNPLQILTTTMPNARVGNAYSELIRTNGGIGPYTFSKTGSLPTDLILNPTTGIISGTPTSAGYVTLGLTVTDSSYPTPQSITQALGVRTSSQMTITSTTNLPSARLGAAISPFMFTVVGGTSHYAWSLTGGNLPNGLTLNAASGTISGTPQEKGDFIFTIHLSDSAGNATGTTSNPDKQFILHVSGPLSVITASVPTGGVGIPFGTTLEATGGIKPYIWAVTTGTLPTGLTLNASTGAITGTPSAKITSSVTFTVTDSDVPPQMAQKSITFDVSDTISIVEKTLPIGRKNQAFTTSIHAQLGTTPYTWRVSAGALPTGLALTQNAGTATISGTPTVSGSYTFTLEVTDSSASPQVVIRQYTVNVYDPIAITTVNLKNAERTLVYSDTVSATGGLAPFIYSLTIGTLPQGLILNSTTGVISGTPPAVTSQNSTFTIRATDSGTPSDYLDKQFTILVTEPVPVDGVCGDSNGSILAVAPTTNLCSPGTPSASGVWAWDCAGQYGGATTHCSATLGYLLSATVFGSGNVQSSSTVAGVPSDILCSNGTCSAGYPSGNIVNLTATPNPTSTFGSWSDSCTADPCIVTMSAAKGVTATFIQAPLAKNNTTGITYATLAEALTDAATGAEVLILNAQYDGDVSLSKALILNGGWNATYLSKSGLPSELNGDLTILNGDSKSETLVVNGKIAVKGGSLRVKDVKLQP